jgi:hypothetical protein
VEEQQMTLRVALRDGFRDDHVVIALDGRVVYDKRGVTTDLSISFADAVEIPLERGGARLEVDVQGRTRSATDLRLPDTPFVDVSVLDGELSFRKSSEQTPML